MAATPKDKFDAAVKVIQSLPKNGSFQPSNELMLKFYAFYKQATLGRCTTTKPSFWDVVGKAKWDAWNKLGEMSQEDAMLSYVEELKKIMEVQFDRKIDKERIVEAMPHTTMVADFVQTLGSFYEVVDDKGLPNGSTRRENGFPAIEGSPPENGSDGNMLPIPESDFSSDSGSVGASSESSPVHTSPSVIPVSDDNQVVMATIPTKAIPNTDWSNVSPPLEVPLLNNNSDVKGEPEHVGHNGDAGSVGVNGVMDSVGETDSEAEEEFCDTSDLPQQLPLSVSQCSTPDPTIPSETHIVTTATIHYPTDTPSVSVPATDSLRQSLFRSPQHVTAGVVSRGGGDTDGESPSQQINAPRNPDNFSQQPLGNPEPTQSMPQQSAFVTAGGSGGGGQNPGTGASRSEVSEQIALALVRLQQDMNSVLARLNTLEALSVAQHQMQRSRHSSESDKNTKKSVWWWPFGNLGGKTVFLLLVWPVFVHMVLSTLRRRHRRK